ncbi:MAG: glutamate synthase subunit alpha, partial [Candidatus Nanopelagicales bacterium]|nr:glutamate synthase subunit alpha [Candidatus Nanopelagicales bacterium]
LLDTRAAVSHWKAEGLDLSPILVMPELSEGTARRQVVSQDHGLEKALDNQLIEMCRDAIERGEPVRVRMEIRNVNRTVGTMLGSEISRRYGSAGLPEETIDITLVGSAGQSFGAFLPRGVTLRLEGDANDYLGKGLSGGRLAIRPDGAAPFRPEEQIIAGNVIAYGATGGEIFIRGQVGERCCVRNSGATVVVEGAGDHLCEYMTGGRVIVLGATGRNVAAGMSGGITFVLDLDPAAVNGELVDVEPPNDADCDFLVEIIAAHAEQTGSDLARSLLADWANTLSRFSKIMPRDYRRVLNAIALAEELGEDPDRFVMEVASG